MKIEESLKEMFVEMCRHITIGKDGIVCHFDNIEFNDDLAYISQNDKYPLLKEKMNNLLVLIEKDFSILDKDIETEIWYLL